MIDMPKYTPAFADHTRESWLKRAADEMWAWIAAKGQTPNDHCRYSCGFPAHAALATKKRRIGECWSFECSADKSTEILISPVLDNRVEVLATLLHEMVHATVGLDCKHRGPFRVLAVSLGLEGKMTEVNPGTELIARLHVLAEKLGAYPHARIEGLAKTNAPPKQGTRMLKLTCEHAECGYTVRTTKKWLEQGLPTCHCGGAFASEEGEPEPE